MTTVDLRTPAGEASGTLELPGDVFDVQVNVPLIHQVVVSQLAAARQGTASTRTRGEVRGGGKKPYRQKGTGRARQGSTRAPQFAGGGVVHGPTPREYSQRTPKKMKAAALRAALSDRARAGRVHVVTGLVDGATPSTKAAAQALAQLSDRAHLLVVVERSDEVTWKSVRNLGNVHLISHDQLNTYDVLVSDDVVFTHAALNAFLTARSDAGAPEVVAAEPAKAEPAKRAPRTAKAAAAKPAEPAEAVVADVVVAEVVAEAAEPADAEHAEPEVAEPELAESELAEPDTAGAGTAEAEASAEEENQA